MTEPQSQIARTAPAEAIAQMDLAEKAAMTAGMDVWTVPGVERLGLPPLRMTDGPNGARGASFAGNTSRSLCVPCGSALGATFDPDLLGEVGGVLGRDARRKRSRVLLAPTINVPRSPLFGRSFECYSEDPMLAGSLAAAFVAGVQAEGVATTPKHLVGNEAEFERMTIDSIIDERTLREIYLTPFEWTVRHGGALAMMTAYNRLNGQWCAMDPALLDGVLRDDWGFEGLVVTDWFAAGDTVISLESGLDVQMPGPDRFFGAPVATAIENGQVAERRLDDIIERRLHVHAALDAWDDDTMLDELSEEHGADRAIAHRAATESMVLLKNDGLLPIDPQVASLALIGPTAVSAHIMGGGSATLAAHRRPAPVDAMRDRLGDRMQSAKGCDISKHAAPVRPTGGFDVQFRRAGADPASEPIAETSIRTGRILWSGPPTDGFGIDAFTATLTGRLEIEESGLHQFTMVQAGAARVSLDGEVILDGMGQELAPGVAFFGMGSEEISCTRHLEAGQTVELLIEFEGDEGSGLRGVTLGHQVPIPDDLIAQAAKVAASCEVAVVVVGTSAEWETEGEDRTTLDLPGEQRELIEAVRAANRNTVVVINAGAPVEMSWADDTRAVVQAWLGGQEMAPALVDVLLGDAEPAGRLPVTIPVRIEDTPAFGNFPGEHNETRYGEGLLTGYRWYDTRDIAVAFPFGHGGSYTTFAWTEPTITPSGPAAATVTVNVTNTGDRPGTDVVQVYIDAPGRSAADPRAELCGYAKVRVDPGETTTATINVRPRAFARWNPARPSADTLRASAASTAHDAVGGIAGWYIAAGEAKLEISHAIGDVEHTLAFQIDDPIGPLEGNESAP